jgi:hypothetical protein
LQELSFYAKQRLVPTARKMGYRLIELAVAAKKVGHDPPELGLPDLPDPTDANYHREKKLFFDKFYGDSAEARKGVDSTYSKKTYLPKLPINCFRDDLRETIGETDIDVDNKFYEDTDITIREKMVQMATEAFKSGWEKE